MHQYLLHNVQYKGFTESAEPFNFSNNSLAPSCILLIINMLHSKEYSLLTKTSRSYLSNVKMYLGLAESLPPESRVPNWPIGCRRLILLLPTKFWAKLTIVDMSDCSPWWYDECSATEPASWATLISRLSARFKQVKSTWKIIYHISIIEQSDDMQSYRKPLSTQNYIDIKTELHHARATDRNSILPTLAPPAYFTIFAACYLIIRCSHKYWSRQSQDNPTSIFDWLTYPRGGSTEREHQAQSCKPHAQPRHSPSG